MPLTGLRPFLVVVALAVLAGCGSTAPPPPPAPTSTDVVLPDAPDGTRPAVTDSAGTALPRPVADGAARLFTALQEDDSATVESMYAPRPGSRAASWSKVATRLGVSYNRRGLRNALTKPPQRRPEVAWLFSALDFGVGMNDDGTIAFLGVRQAPNDPARAAVVASFDACSPISTAVRKDLALVVDPVPTTTGLNDAGVSSDCSYYDNQRAFTVTLTTADDVQTRRLIDEPGLTYSPYSSGDLRGETAEARNVFLECWTRIDTSAGLVDVRVRGRWPGSNSCAVSQLLAASTAARVPQR